MISLKGVDHVIACTAVDGKILLRTYAVGFRKSGTKVNLQKMKTSLHIIFPHLIGCQQVPTIALSPMGAYMDLSVRRTQIAADDIFKGACRKPKRYVTVSPKLS